MPPCRTILVRVLIQCLRVIPSGRANSGGLSLLAELLGLFTPEMCLLSSLLTLVTLRMVRNLRSFVHISLVVTTVNTNRIRTGYTY